MQELFLVDDMNRYRMRRLHRKRDKYLNVMKMDKSLKRVQVYTQEN